MRRGRVETDSMPLKDTGPAEHHQELLRTDLPQWTPPSVRIHLPGSTMVYTQGNKTKNTATTLQMGVSQKKVPLNHSILYVCGNKPTFYGSSLF